MQFLKKLNVTSLIYPFESKIIKSWVYLTLIKEAVNKKSELFSMQLPSYKQIGLMNPFSLTEKVSVEA
jgi:hypothetical protein